MTREEHAIRLTAWTWAVDTLGAEATPERIDGLVEVTEVVSAENLKDAIRDAIRANPSGFLPAPNLVISCGAKIAERKRRQWAEEKRERIRASASRQVLAERVSGGNSAEMRRHEAKTTIDELREKIRMGAELERGKRGARTKRPEVTPEQRAGLAAVDRVLSMTEDERNAWLANEMREEAKRNAS